MAAKRPMGRLKRSLDLMVPSPMMKTRDVRMSNMWRMRSLSESKFRRNVPVVARLRRSVLDMKPP